MRLCRCVTPVGVTIYVQKLSRKWFICFQLILTFIHEGKLLKTAQGFFFSLWEKPKNGKYNLKFNLGEFDHLYQNLEVSIIAVCPCNRGNKGKAS